jgi:hypothetical protein
VILYRVPQLTIVYPAAAGEEGETNRYSAERRAATLRGLSGAKVEVVADNALTAAQRKGHLLLLGWGNRVLSADKLERPFRHGRDAGTRFAGIVEPDADIDLLFLVRSPWNSESWLFFWSRIDPEMELFQSLPRWARTGRWWTASVSCGRACSSPGTPGRRCGTRRPRRSTRTDILEVEKNWVQLKTERYTISYDPATTPKRTCARSPPPARRRCPRPSLPSGIPDPTSTWTCSSTRTTRPSWPPPASGAPPTQSPGAASCT